MAARTHSVDPRAERVRTRLREAAFALAHERQVDQLTVGDIVTRASVSRQAFYQHFTDRDDAVASAFTVAFAAATADTDCLDDTDVGPVDARACILRLFDFAAEHRSMYRNIVPSAVTQRVVAAFRAELQPACLQIAEQGMPLVSPVAGLTPESVSRFLVGGFMEVLRSWMESPDPTDLSGRVAAALDTVNALLGLTTYSKGPQHG
jgi:AcrR family transcriptional regulator